MPIHYRTPPHPFTLLPGLFVTSDMLRVASGFVLTASVNVTLEVMIWHADPFSIDVFEKCDGYQNTVGAPGPPLTLPDPKHDVQPSQDYTNDRVDHRVMLVLIVSAFFLALTLGSYHHIVTPTLSLRLRSSITVHDSLNVSTQTFYEQKTPIVPRTARDTREKMAHGAGKRWTEGQRETGT